MHDGVWETEPLDMDIPAILSITLIKTTKDWYLKHLKNSDHWIIAYTLSGECVYRWEDQVVTQRRGDAFFFHQGFTRSAQSDPDNPWTFIVFKFRLVAGNEATAQWLENLPSYYPRVPAVLSDLMVKAQKTWQEKRSGYLLQCKGALYAILYQLTQLTLQQRFSKSHLGLMNMTLQMIDDNMDKNFSLQALAQAAGMSISRFRTVFKEHTGYSVVKYQNYRKIARAYDLLLTENYTVSEAGALVGINDVYYFSRLFKQIMGFSPSKALEGKN